MSRSPRHLCEFGPFRLDICERRLLHKGERVALTPKAFETLMLLVDRAGHLVEKGELMEALWPGIAVEEANLTNNIWTLRKALGDDPGGQRYIETVPKRGYRFVAAVRELPLVTPLLAEKVRQTPLVAAGPKPHQPLRGLLAAALACLLVLGALAALNHAGVVHRSKEVAAAAAGGSALHSIAVLPFRTIGAGKDEDYLGVGMSDALIVKLGGLRRVIVRPMSAVRRYAEGAADPLGAGRQQRVEAVLDGSIQRAGDRIRVSVQLLRVEDGAALWSGQFNEKFTDMFAVQDSISERVTCGLFARVCKEGARPLRHEQINMEAYQAYAKGRYFWNKRTREGFQKALDSFNQAIAIDPTYAQAYAGLGDALSFLGGHDPASAVDQKVTAAELRALELDETLAEAHASLGLLAFDVDFREAERQLKRAIELNPNYSSAHQWYGEFLAYMGRFDEAMAEIERAHEIDPLSLIISTDVAKVYSIARQYDRAIEQFKQSLELEANFDEAHALLGMAYVFAGRAEEGVAELHKISDPEDPSRLAFLGYACGAAGKRREAQEVRRKLERLATQTYVAPYWMTFVDMGLGEKERVFAELEQMFNGHPNGKVSLKVNPIYDSLRSDPRYAALMLRAEFGVLR